MEVNFIAIGAAVLLLAILVDRIAKKMTSARERRELHERLSAKLDIDFDAYTPKKSPVMAATLVYVIDNLATLLLIVSEVLASIMTRTLARTKMNKQPKEIPPKRAQKILSYLLKPSDIEPVLGDMDELYNKQAQRFGHKSARRWYIFQTLRSVVGLLRGRLMKLGIFAYLHDIINKIISP